MQQPARSYLHRDEYIQDAKISGDRNEEITADDACGVVANERRPALIACSSGSGMFLQIFADRARRDVDAELQQMFISDALLALRDVLSGHSAHQQRRFVGSFGLPRGRDFQRQK